jgi:hypothetical protein
MFEFTISDLGQFLKKSPVTLRAWERKGLLSIPRVGTKRLLTIDEVLEVANIALNAGRISQTRWENIRLALYYLQQLEN